MFGGEDGSDVLPMIEDRISRGAEVREEDVEPELWLASAALLDIFWELHEWRGSGGMGPGRITLVDLNYYCSFYQFVLSSFEVRAIRLIDNYWLSSYKPLKTE